MSGSSEASIWLDHSKSLWRSSWGTPSRSAIAWSGSSAATSSTKLPWPRSTASATILAARSVMISSSAAIDRGVNAREMMWRVAVCSGGSWLIRITRWSSTCSRDIPSEKRMIAPFS